MKVTLVQFGITLQSLWSHSGYAKVRFKKTLIFHTDFNGFVKRWRLTCRIEKQISLMIMSIRMRFGCILGPLWGILGSLWVTLGHLGVALGSIWILDGSMCKSNMFCRVVFASRRSGTHRKPAPGNSKRYQSINPFD